MDPEHSRDGSVERDYIVYLTEHRDGWTLGLDTGTGAVRELGHYCDRAIAVRFARAAVCTHQARLMVQWSGGTELLGPADVVNAVIAGEPAVNLGSV